MTTSLPSAGDTTGRRERRRQRTRRALREAALRLFTDRGIAATRLEDLTEHADLGKGAFYNYYDSKDALVADLLEEAFDRLNRDYLAEASSTGPFTERIVAILHAHDRFFGQHPEYLILFHHARGLVKSSRESQARLSHVFSRYLTRLGDLIPSPDMRREWTDEQCRDLAAAVAGTIAGYRSYGQAIGVMPRASTLELLFLGGLPRLFDARWRESAARPGPDAREGSRG